MGMKQNENIQVSVVIPVYNVQAYLKECLDSVMSQNFQKMEVILVTKQIGDFHRPEIEE